MHYEMRQTGCNLSRAKMHHAFAVLHASFPLHPTGGAPPLSLQYASKQLALGNPC